MGWVGIFRLSTIYMANWLIHSLGKWYVKFRGPFLESPDD